MAAAISKDNDDLVYLRGINRNELETWDSRSHLMLGRSFHYVDGLQEIQQYR